MGDIRVLGALAGDAAFCKICFHKVNGDSQAYYIEYSNFARID
jgi:hypothetical protein